MRTTTCLCLTGLAALLLAACGDGRSVQQGDGSADGPGTDAKQNQPDGVLRLDAGPLPDARQTCAPGDPPLLEARLAKQGAQYVARVKNVGCAVAARLVGCCGEGDPMVELLKADGSWGPSGCPGPPRMCCDGMPGCQTLGVGETLDLTLDLAPCPAGVYRVVVSYGTQCADPPWETKTPLSARSNPVTIAP